MKGLARRNTYVKYESSTTNQLKDMTKVKVFEKKVKFQGQKSGQKSWYQIKGLARRNTNVQYESLTTNQSNVMTKVNVFKKVKLQGQMVKVMVSNKRSYQKKYTCAI
jgi:DNA-binding transcriptional regulator of glucitol operon